MLEILLNELPLGIFRNLNNKFTSFFEHESYDILSCTFLDYCKCNMNISEAACKLFIHRNSLIYRLEKIKTLTDLDVSNFKHITLYLTIKNNPSVNWKFQPNNGTRFSVFSLPVCIRIKEKMVDHIRATILFNLYDTSDK